MIMETLSAMYNKNENITPARVNCWPCKMKHVSVQPFNMVKSASNIAILLITAFLLITTKTIKT